MDLAGRVLWQVGTGDGERSYGTMCTAFDVMIAGPGARGCYEVERYADCGDVRRFCREARRHDLVLLRRGGGEVLAVGEIADDGAEWSELFSDVDGWDLQHVRRVRWFPNTNKSFPARTFGGQVRRFASVNVQPVKTWIESLEIPTTASSRELAPLPEPGASMDPAKLGERLYIEGLSSEYVDKLMATFASLQRVASWYWNKTKRPNGRPSEQETVCYLVIPFLLSLGWSQQTAAIQWNFIDVALFRGMPPNDSTLACVVEAKLLDRSVLTPVGQAEAYALRPGRESCDKLIVTDGIRYALYRRRGGNFNIDAYLNILDMREAYPILGCTGAVHAVLGMARG